VSGAPDLPAGFTDTFTSRYVDAGELRLHAVTGGEGPPPLNAMLWHLAFNQLPKINEQLVTGREDIFFGAEFDASAGTHKLPDGTVRYYIDTLKDPDHLRGSFGFYRAIPTTSAQNQQRKERRLTLPVLAIGGAESTGETVGNTMKLAADDVQTLVIPGCAHWVAEQAPEQLLTALTAFLAPYRDRAAAAPSPR
jgi:pimeloyl-ACP methyl ester carboxylesterase